MYCLHIFFQLPLHEHGYLITSEKNIYCEMFIVETLILLFFMELVKMHVYQNQYKYSFIFFSRGQT